MFPENRTPTVLCKYLKHCDCYGSQNVYVGIYSGAICVDFDINVAGGNILLRFYQPAQTLQNIVSN